MSKFIKENLATVTSIIFSIMVIAVDHIFQKKLPYPELLSSLLLFINTLCIGLITSRCSITIKIKTDIREFDNSQEVRMSLLSNQKKNLNISISGEKIKKRYKNKNIYIKFPAYVEVTPTNLKSLPLIENIIDDNQVIIKIPFNELDDGESNFKFVVSIMQDNILTNSFSGRTVSIYNDFKIPINFKTDILIIDWGE